MAYATAAELRAYIGKSVVTSDTQLTELLAAAEVHINQLCKRPDGFQQATATARTFAGSGGKVQWVDAIAATPTLVEVKESYTDTTYTAWATTDWMVGRGDPEQPDFNHAPYQWLRIDEANGDYASWTVGANGAPTVRVTAQWADAVTVPYDIKIATIMQAAKWYKRLQGAMTDTLASSDFGTLIYTQPVDPDIRGILKDGGYLRVVVG